MGLLFRRLQYAEKGDLTVVIILIAATILLILLLCFFCRERVRKKCCPNRVAPANRLIKHDYSKPSRKPASIIAKRSGSVDEAHARAKQWSAQAAQRNQRNSSKNKNKRPPQINLSTITLSSCASSAVSFSHLLPAPRIDHRPSPQHLTAPVDAVEDVHVEDDFHVDDDVHFDAVDDVHIDDVTHTEDPEEVTVIPTLHLNEEDQQSSPREILPLSARSLPSDHELRETVEPERSNRSEGTLTTGKTIEDSKFSSRNLESPTLALDNLANLTLDEFWTVFQKHHQS